MDLWCHKVIPELPCHATEWEETLWESTEWWRVYPAQEVQSTLVFGLPSEDVWFFIDKHTNIIYSGIVIYC